MKLGSPKYSSHSRTFCKHFILCLVLINKLRTSYKQTSNHLQRHLTGQKQIENILELITNIITTSSTSKIASLYIYLCKPTSLILFINQSLKNQSKASSTQNPDSLNPQLPIFTTIKTPRGLPFP